MDYYGLLFLYYLKGLSGKSVLKLFFNIEAGGTEQLLPENTSTPTTTPILADIQYPDGLRTDQYFTYRETPTTVSNKARIKTIKGNTLVWNQLIAKGNMTDGWTFSNVTGNYADNVLTFTASAGNGFVRPDSPQNIIANHKYLGIIDIKGVSSFATYIYFTGDNGSHFNVNVTTNWQTVARVFTNPNTASNWYPRIFDARQSGWDAISIRNCMLIDLTQMGLDITDPSEFTSLFPLSYYAYNQGSLLSFNGNGIKTVGFNQWDEEWESGRINSDGTKASSSTYIRSKNYIHIFPNTTYYRKSPNNIQPFYYDGNMNFISYGLCGANSTFSTPNNAEYMLFHIDPAYDTTYKNDICINISDTSKNGTYEPYTESTLSLPISTYFPSGMKSAGNVYDELTESKAISRIGAVDLGSLTWSYVNQQYNIFQADLTDMKANADWQRNVNFCSSMYHPSPSGMSSMDDLGVRQVGNNLKQIIVRNTAYTDANTFKTAMNGVYLYYELATPLENYGVVDLGTLDWIYNDSFKRFHSTGLSSLAKFPSNDNTVANILSNEFATVTALYFNNNKTVDKLVALSMYGSIYARNLSMTDVNEFKSSLSGVYLLYEKENPQGFTTASLVTENVEIPLSNNDGTLIGKCTEQLSAEPGFHDAKIKLSDADGECYSNKLQLHVERSPQ